MKLKTKLPVPRVKDLLFKPSKAEVRLTKTQFQDIDAQGAIHGDGTIKYTNISSYNPKQPNYHPLAYDLQTCPLIYAYIMYDPTLAGNALFLSIFSLLLPIQIFLGLHYRTSGILLATFFGLSTEFIGYVGRVRMHVNLFLKQDSLMYLIP